MNEIYSVNAGYFVQDDFYRGAYFLVDGSDCSCPAGVLGKSFCLHRRLVAELVKAQNAAAKRPIAPPNVVALLGEEPYRPGAA